MSSKEDVKGACNCGTITVSVAADKWPESSSLCHCLNCRASSSGLATLNLATPVSAITITSGTPKVYHEKEAASGAPMERRFCGDCGSPIMSVSSKAPELAFLKSGLFAKGFHKEGKTLPKPNAEIYWSRAEKWEEALKGKGGWNVID